MKRFAVFGHPIAHSRSPFIHQRFAELTGIPVDYQAIEAPLDSFKQSVCDFRQAGGRGANVTVPFKIQAFEMARHLTSRARLAQAVNTLYWDQERQLWGDNTDGAGLVRDLTHNHQLTLKAQKILILGAGGAVRGVLGSLLEQKPQKLALFNRTVEKAQYLVQSFSDLGPVCLAGFDDGDLYDLIINATSASLLNQLPPCNPAWVGRATVCYDMVYAKHPTSFMDWSAKAGAGQAIDGLGMLVEQAAESFYIWHGVRPPVESVFDELRAALS